MQYTQRQEQYGNHHLSVYYRHRSVGRHAHRLASHGRSRDWHFFPGTSGSPALETGAALALHGCGALNPLIWFPSDRALFGSSSQRRSSSYHWCVQ